MSVAGIAAGVAFAFQVTGGMTVGLVAGNVIAQSNSAANSGVQLDPALAAAYGAIGALFGLVTWLAKGRIERCENREDKMLGADSDKTATMKELSSAVAKAAEVTVSAVSAANIAVEESRRIGGKVDGVQSAVGQLASTVSDLSHEIRRLSDQLSANR